MTTEFQKQVKKELQENPSIFTDSIVCKKDGSVEVKKSYFYSHGYDAEKWAAKVSAALTVAHNVQGRDDWAAWPKTSYFTAIITPV